MNKCAARFAHAYMIELLRLPRRVVVVAERARTRKAAAQTRLICIHVCKHTIDVMLLVSLASAAARSRRKRVLACVCVCARNSIPTIREMYSVVFFVVVWRACVCFWLHAWVIDL